MDRVRRRIGDKRVLALVKAFLKAGILTEDGIIRDTITGTPQGGILSPLLANIALSVLDEHFAEPGRPRCATTYRRGKRRRKGLANYRLVRYADDFVVLVAAAEPTPRRCGRRWQRCSPRSACACRRRRRGSSTSTRASTSSGSASSGTESEARTSATSTPTRPRRPLASVKAKVQTLTRQDRQPAARRPAAPAQPGAARLDHLLPARRVQGDLRLPAPLHLAAGGPLAPSQAPPGELEVAAAPLPSKVVADRGRGRRCSTRRGGGHPLPLPGQPHPHTMAEQQRPITKGSR